MKRILPLEFFFLGMGWMIAASAGETPEAFPKPTPNNAEEAPAKSLSLAASARFLDGVAVNWTRERKCATCHTNVPYLMARSALKEYPSEGASLVRRFLEERVAHWDDDTPGAKPRSDADVVVTAAALAFHDAGTSGKLHPLTRKALDRMWTLQRPDGAWNWLKCNWPPMEHDDYFGAVLADLAVSVAPNGYDLEIDTTQHLVKLRRYLSNTPPPSLHHKTWLLWADSLSRNAMKAEEKKQAIKELLALQREDGGWSLPSLGDWKGNDGRRNDKNAPSDGYATGLVTYVLRQAGLPTKHEAIQRGVGWLRTHQRESGRWFTRSLNSDRAHYVTNAGTAFAVLALTSCGEK